MNIQKLILPTMLATALSAAMYPLLSNAVASPSKGLIPKDARKADGSIDVQRVPDFVVAYARDGSIAGYVRKTDIFRETRGMILAGAPTVPGTLTAPVIPVVDERLDKVVGHMVPGRGFVRVGVRPEDVPAFVLDEQGD